MLRPSRALSARSGASLPELSRQQLLHPGCRKSAMLVCHASLRLALMFPLDTTLMFGRIAAFAATCLQSSSRLLRAV
ncbi:protein of unknown function [Cupriavidus taiwanensis]|nr:protein of unknown function [Cupriavidus taiwanensis]